MSHNTGYLGVILLHISKINQKKPNLLNKWKHTHISTPHVKIKDQEAPLYYHPILLHANTFRSYSDCKQPVMEGTPHKCLFRFGETAEGSLSKAFAMPPSLKSTFPSVLCTHWNRPTPYTNKASRETNT